MEVIYRVQNIIGRSPSPQWGEVGTKDKPKPWREEFDAIAIYKKRQHGEIVASGCRTLEQLRKWFTEDELLRLTQAMFGFYVVTMEVDRIIAESENQVVFARMKPLGMHVQSVNLSSK